MKLTNFLSEENKETLAKALAEAGCSQDIVDHMTVFPEEMADDHTLAHARVCIKASNGECKNEFLGLSAICLTIIEKEAKERGWTAAHFPKALPFMNGFTAAYEREQSGHTLN